MKMSISRTTLRWTVGGVIVAVVAIVVSIVLWADTDSAAVAHTQTQSGQHNTQLDNGGIVNNGTMSITPEQFAQQVQTMSVPQARQLALQYARIAPPATGPAPYTIVGAPHDLFVRSSGTADGFHIGAVSNGVTVWADCQMTTSFDPDQTDDTGSVWLRIRWYTNQPNDALANPQTSGGFPGWVYAGFTVPAGHDGKIPTCA